MKVLQINAVYGKKSTGMIVRDIDNMLIEKGHSSYVGFQDGDISDTNKYKIGNVVDWKIHALFTRLLGKQGYCSKRATKKFLAQVTKIQPDIIHLHNLHANYIHLNVLLNYVVKNDISLVITLHDCWFFTGKCFHYVESNCEKWKTQCQHCPRNKMDIKSWFFDESKTVYNDKKSHFAMVKNLTVVACSNWMARQAKQSFLRERDIRTIYNGVDIQLFKPHSTTIRETFNLEKKFLIFGAANKWLDCKNKELLDYFVSNLAEDECLILFGCSQEDKERLKFYEKVKALDYIYDRSVIADWFATVDVFANVTFADTLPTVNMEATACGTPVVTYDVGGSSELVEEGVTGYVIDVNDYVEFFNAIKKIKNKNIQREKCRIFAEQNFDKNKNYLDYLSLYENILFGEKNR